MSVKEILHRIKGRSMLFTKAVQQCKVIAERLPHLLQTIPLEVEPAAFQRAAVGEGREDEMSPRFKRSPEIGEIRFTVLRNGQKVKNGAIVPEFEMVFR
jgi:hypothetical protein